MTQNKQDKITRRAKELEESDLTMQASKAVELIKKYQLNNVLILLDESDYNTFSNYGETAIKLLAQELRKLGINHATRYVYGSPSKNPETGAYKLFTDLNHTASERLIPNASAYDSLVLICSEGIQSESQETEFPKAQCDHDLIKFVHELPDDKYKKIFLTPYPERIRENRALYSKVLFDVIIAQGSSALHPVNEKERQSLRRKAEPLDIISSNNILAFLQTYGHHKEYLQAAKLISRYKVICINQEALDHMRSLGHPKTSYTSIEELQKKHPYIPEYVFTNVLSSSLTHEIGRGIFQLNNSHNTTDISDYLNSIPDMRLNSSRDSNL